VRVVPPKQAALDRHIADEAAFSGAIDPDHD
jgi:hypothetical protein